MTQQTPMFGSNERTWVTSIIEWGIAIGVAVLVNSYGTMGGIVVRSTEAVLFGFMALTIVKISSARYTGNQAPNPGFLWGISGLASLLLWIYTVLFTSGVYLRTVFLGLPFLVVFAMGATQQRWIPDEENATEGSQTTSVTTNRVGESPSDSSSESPPAYQVVAGMAVAIILGILLIGAGVYTWFDYQVQAQGDFEKTEATIVSSEVKYDAVNTEYELDITYEYTVDGDIYRNSNVFPGQEVERGYSRSRAQEIVENHPEGQTEAVYYDPQNPSNAFLVRRDPPWEIIVTTGAFGVFAILIGFSFRGWLNSDAE